MTIPSLSLLAKAAAFHAVAGASTIILLLAIASTSRTLWINRQRIIDALLLGNGKD